MSEGSISRFAGATLDVERKELTIRWGDGHVSVYPLAYLRRNCPCATCRQQREQTRAGGLMVLPSGAVSASDDIETLSPVGRYALQPVWSDGHSTGIFSFEFLRELCPCPECRATTGKPG